MKRFFVKYNTATTSNRVSFFSTVEIRNEFIGMVNYMRHWKLVSFGQKA